MSMADDQDDPPELKVTIPSVQDLPDVAKPWKDAPVPTEVLLITVKDLEFLGCYMELKNPFYSYHPDLGQVYFGQIGSDNVRVALLTCSEASSGSRGSLITTTSAIANLRPKVVLCVGYCGGLSREKTNLGDVVISNKLTMYDHKKVTKDGEEARGPSATPVSRQVADLIRYAAFSWKPPLADPASRSVSVYQDAEFLSGPELVNSPTRRNELLARHPRALAIEMEGQGIFSAAHDMKVEWVIIKGISDFADGTKSSTAAWQPFASVMAASVFANIFKRPGILKHWRHYNSMNQPGHNKTAMSFGLRFLVLLLAIGVVWMSSQTNMTAQPQVSPTIPSPPNPNAVHDAEKVSSLLDSITGGSPGQVNFKGRVIGYRAHGRVHSLKEPWVYDGMAWDVGSGINAKVKHYSNSEDAIRDAVLKVVNDLKTKGIIVDQ